MPAKHAPGRKADEGDAASQQQKRSHRAGTSASPPYAPVIERRIRRLQAELDDVARSRPWGPALGFTAAWLGLMAVFVGLVIVDDIVTVAGVLAMLALVPAFLATSARRRQEARLRAEIDDQERRLEGEEPERSPVDRLLHAHLDHLDRHFRLVAEHADRGFLVAIAVTGLGFLLAVIGLVLGIRGGSTGGDMAVVAAASGIAMQGVAAALFFIYARSLGHLRAFQDRLGREQETLLAFHHAAALPDPEARERVLSGLISSVVISDRRGPPAEGSEDWDVSGLLRRASS